MRKADIGLIGLAVMGQNLVLNMSDNGYRVSVFNRSYDKTAAFLQGPAAGKSTIAGFESLEELVSSLERPRKIMLMVKAGKVVDIFIQKLLLPLGRGQGRGGEPADCYRLSFSQLRW